mgnify:CR=1 FL=1
MLYRQKRFPRYDLPRDRQEPNHVEKGVISMTVDGKDVDVSGISGGMIPIALADGKKDVNVEVVMG